MKKKIHIKRKHNKLDMSKCCAKLKSGKKKGSICTYKARYKNKNKPYCGKHKKEGCTKIVKNKRTIKDCDLCEKQICELLKNNIAISDIEFNLIGGNNSTKPDIEVLFKKSPLFNIESKCKKFQVAQFTISKQNDNYIISDSCKDKSETQPIIDKINKGEEILDSLIFNRIIVHLINGGNMYVVYSYETNPTIEDLIICRPDEISNYFDIEKINKNHMRYKRSGSSGKLTIKDRKNIKIELKKIMDEEPKIVCEENKYYICIDEGKQQKFENSMNSCLKFGGINGNEKYILSPKYQPQGKYQIKKRAKPPKNPTVIFSLKPKEKCKPNGIERIKTIRQDIIKRNAVLVIQNFYIKYKHN